MLINIGKVTVGKRIRKDYGDITSLADDIEDRGLINPPVVTPDYELIAGERRLRALKKLDYKQIEVRVMSVEDYEHQLQIEISENEERKDFTYSEKMDYAKQLERIEAKKAKERMATNKKGTVPGPYAKKGETREIVGKKVGFGSGRTYGRAKYIYENADEEFIKKVDSGEKSIKGAYEELRPVKKKQKEVPDMNAPENLVESPIKEKRTPVKRDRREEINARADAMTEEETNIALSEASASNIASICTNFMYTVDNIQDLELTLRFLKTQETKDLENVIKASKALIKIIEKGDLKNV
ncbi:ParB N-terminal domain-containing protein [Staphylococcus sp. GDY8P95P]|uniref:ParB N-terminal domain-containing protein n=1 Tax=Staphylococcus sp. GDY8P95P TaxID=2804145 RepID=UPI001AEC6139|nr:ParB N-terminal domain-containing protein [Staphylococcus sp. GDY8P95P]